MNILAIDIGGTMIKYGLVSSDGKILSTDEIKTEASKGLNNILNNLFYLLNFPSKLICQN